MALVGKIPAACRDEHEWESESDIATILTLTFRPGDASIVHFPVWTNAYDSYLQARRWARGLTLWFMNLRTTRETTSKSLSMPFENTLQTVQQITC